jgi:phosphoribosylformylglycinamidine cyclo-ligase
LINEKLERYWSKCSLCGVKGNKKVNVRPFMNLANVRDEIHGKENKDSGKVEMTAKRSSGSYQDAGVDTEREEEGLKLLVSRIKKTWPSGEGFGSVKLDIGFFANVIDLGGIGLAISADGVGSKVLVAQMMGKYDTVGIDCVAMNVNDILCVGARPISMVDYIAIQEAKPRLLDEIAIGLCEGAKMANISISGGEIAQLQDIINGQEEGYGFDLAGMAVGTVALDKFIIGKNIDDGDVIIGLESNGIHSNGATLARRTFFQQNNFTIQSEFSELDCPLGEELLKPTYIYVKEIMEMLDLGLAIKALVHITSDGFLNLTRGVSAVAYHIEELPPIPPIFELIQKYGRIPDEEMFRVYNMGIGFCILVSPKDADRVISIARSHGKRARRIGYATPDELRRVYVREKGLVGQGKRFEKAKG